MTKLQIEKQLSQCNIKIASLTSTIGSKTVLNIVEHITGLYPKYSTKNKRLKPQAFC